MLEPHILVFLIYLSILTNFVHAETCTESSDTKEIVLRCPANKLEWEEAARKKNCSAIHGIENCKGVEYHCLVNTLRDEVVEVCSTPRLLHGHCPIYTSTNTSIIKSPRNDYDRPCKDSPPPLNCSTVYLSTDAYKWQNCYDVVYKISKDNTETTRPIQTRDKNRSQESGNDLTALWIIPAILGTVLVIYISFVVYNVKVKKRAWRKALCLCGECPFKCLDNLSCCLDDGKIGNPEEDRLMTETPVATPNENSRGAFVAQNGENVEMHDGNRREDDREQTSSDAADGNNSGTPVTDAAERQQMMRENEGEPVPPNGENREEPVQPNGENREEPVPPNRENREEPVPPNRENREEPVQPNRENREEPVQPNRENREEPVQPNGENREELVQPNEENGEERVPPNGENGEGPVSPNAKKLEIPVQSSDKSKEESKTPITQLSPDGSKYSMHENPPPNKQLNRLPLEKRLAFVKEELYRLKTRLDGVNGHYLLDLEYQVTSISKKIENFFETNLQLSKKIIWDLAANIETKVSDLESNLSKYHLKLDDLDDFEKRDLSLDSTKSVGEEQIGINKQTELERKDDTGTHFRNILEESAEKSLVTVGKAENSVTEQYEDEYKVDRSKGNKWDDVLRRPSADVCISTRVLREEACDLKQCPDDDDTSTYKSPETKSREEKAEKLLLEVMAFTKKFEDYKSKKERKFGNIKIYSQQVWEIENDFNLISKIYGLTGNGETQFRTDPTKTIKEMESNLHAAENYFEEKKLLL